MAASFNVRLAGSVLKAAGEPRPLIHLKDVRAACQSAQSRIMRLQQATNNQVGLTTATREGWFEELRQVAQCFITAQQVSAKLERTVITERAQLQGALSHALNERDLRESERDSAVQEVQFLRGRLNELSNQLGAHGIGPPRLHLEPTTKRGSWGMPGEDSLSDSPEMVSFPDSQSTDILQQLPATVEDMPMSPKNENHELVHKPGFSPPDSTNSSGFGDPRQLRAATPRNPNQYRNNQSRFFGRNGGSLMQRNPSGYASSPGTNTPEFANGSRMGRFSQSPGAGSYGPFPPPPPLPPPTPQQPQRPGGRFQEHRRTGSSPSRMGNGAGPGALTGPHPSLPKRPEQPPAFSPPQGQQAPQALQQNGPRPSTANPPRPPTPVPGKELVLVRNDHFQHGEFSPGVALPDGSHDEGRVRDIFEFFNAVKHWVNKHCSVPNVDAMHSLSRQFPRLWDYACSVTYPNNRHNAASHSLFMLCNRTNRTYFISRLVIQFVVQQMWNPQAWEGLDEKLTDVLVSVKHRLDLKYGYDAVLQPHERHALVEKRSRAIYDFMRLPTWPKVKSQKINQCANRFKDLVGPMMNAEKIDHQGALHELVGLCESALRLSAVLNTSRLSFQFIFNECGIKFSDQSHQPLNSSIPARELQSHHWRVMCVVTPGITYRNDAGVSVDPRFLAKANVLVMQ